MRYGFQAEVARLAGCTRSFVNKCIHKRGMPSCSVPAALHWLKRNTNLEDLRDLPLDDTIGFPHYAQEAVASLDILREQVRGLDSIALTRDARRIVARAVQMVFAERQRYVRAVLRKTRQARRWARQAAIDPPDFFATVPAVDAPPKEPRDEPVPAKPDYADDPDPGPDNPPQAWLP
jgi:hypothetical protein